MEKQETTLAIGDSCSTKRLRPAANGASVALSLMELLVVLSIVGVIVGMSVPAMARYSAQARLKATARQVAGFLSLARSLSIGSQAGHTVIMDAEHKEMTVADNASGEALEQKLRLPQGIDIALLSGGESVAPEEIVFMPNGSLRGRAVSLILKDKNKSITVAVSGVTGAVTVE